MKSKKKLKKKKIPMYLDPKKVLDNFIEQIRKKYKGLWSSDYD